jgi:hypothetical protein
MANLRENGSATVESAKPAITWGPIFAGAFAATTATVILLLLGSGLGLTLVSPWSGESASVTTFAASTAIWLVIVQWLSSALGGYLSGRLRTKWVGIHSDEVFFRDTAHGFMAWAVATLIVIGVAGSSFSALLGAQTRAVSTVAAGAASGAAQNAGDISGYFVDSLLRPNDPARLTAPGAEADQMAVGQISRIVAMGALQGDIAKEDRDYLGLVVAARTGLSNQDAQARVEAVLAKAQEMKAKLQETADKARKASATAAILGALSMVIGAFIACVAGAIGGRQRDDDEVSYAV